MSQAAETANWNLKEEIRAYWSKRAETFDLSVGHKIDDHGEADAWRSLFREAFEEAAQGSVLDLACGTGEISRMLLSLGARVTAIDFAEPMLQRARAKNGAAADRYVAYACDAEQLLEADSTFDAVVTRHLVWTLVNAPAAFREWHRVLKPGGRLLIVDGDFINLSPLGRLRITLAQFVTRWAGSARPGRDPETHQRILSQVHYSTGLSPERLTADLAEAGFVAPRFLSLDAVITAQMARAGLSDRLRLPAHRRFALCVRKQ
jgi:ubiquinone/menaquinone biosynthesis C-methylase UbiE